MSQVTRCDIKSCKRVYSKTDTVGGYSFSKSDEMGQWNDWDICPWCGDLMFRFIKKEAKEEKKKGGIPSEF